MPGKLTPGCMKVHVGVLILLCSTLRSWVHNMFSHFRTVSPGLGSNYASKCSSASFPRMVTYILCVENCQNYILTHSCLPIPGRLLKNVKTIHGLRISEWNLCIFFIHWSQGSIAWLLNVDIKTKQFIPWANFSYNIWQTRCSRGCPTNSFVTNSLIH